MDRAAISEGLNAEQREVVEALRGPVCVLAGAGSGKTTTITRRIANQVVSGSFAPDQILAVTFTDKAAGEMRGRLARLGAGEVRARTFHAAALAQLKVLGTDPPSDLLPSKALALRQLGNSLPRPYRFRPAADLATEVEWAKNRRISADAYLSSLNAHEPPIPAELMASIYKRYERGKRERNVIDFEDVLELAIRMFQTDADAHERFAARYHAFTVDEYQDVNLLQETLLRLWLGRRDDLCVVGDDYQSIYGFTGATPEYLLEMPRRFPRTKVVRLEANYRSTPQVLGVANRLVASLGGAPKVLRATRPDGPTAGFRSFESTQAELDGLVAVIRALQQAGVPLEEMAILYRLNFRSEDYEEVLAREGIVYQVRDGAFLTRTSARQMTASLRRSAARDVADQVRKLARRAGYVEELPDGVGDQEVTRQNDLRRLIALAEGFDDGVATAADFVRDIESRFGAGDGRGINLLTYHRAKGLEFEAVFLPRAEDGELPFKRSRSVEAVAEERRLFYVGITRAKTHLWISWVNDGRRKASRFVGELQVDGASARGAERGPRAERVPDAPLLHALKEWRSARARTDSVPAYVVFHDATLQEIARRRCRSKSALAQVPGVGPTKLERYGDEVVAVVEKVRGT